MHRFIAYSVMEPAFSPSVALARTTFLPTQSLSANLRHLQPAHHVSVYRQSRLRCSTSTTPTASATEAPIPRPPPMTSVEIREAFLSYFASKSHARLPSASLIPDDPSILLTIAGMVPFKPIFMGAAPPPSPPRATTSQKCIRTNDIENVGVTKRHHTFFEMLGNFSFGDYFKRTAIHHAWQLLTEVYAIPPARLAVSVFQDDDEAEAIWRDEIGIPPHRIVRLGEADNFWAAGPTGPCGPCSEIYYDFTPESTTPIDLEDDDRFIELYNLVFMQFSRDTAGTLTPLDNKNIDTGMGLERMAQVLQDVPTNYETDLIAPIMACVAELADTTYEKATEKQQTSLKVIGDHLRAIAHLISDGVRPSNVGRGYIVRRLIRRCVRHARMLGIDGPFSRDALPVVADLAYEAQLTGVREKLNNLIEEVEREETRFLVTLERGESRLDDILAEVRESKSNVINGEDAFELYDTFGFPLELTEEIAIENGLTVDKDGFEVSMAEQRRRARAARDTTAFDVDTAAVLSEAVAVSGETTFEGYTRTSLESATITALVVDGVLELTEEAIEGDSVRVLLRTSPFYAEGGGQVGDGGFLTGPNGVVRIDSTKKEAGAYVHIGQVTSGVIRVGEDVKAVVDSSARRRIMAHHTATHLLQAALKNVIPDGGISQAGSLVDMDRLRFDFNCPRPVSADEITKVETMINGWISDAHDMEVSLMTLDEAKNAGAVAMFGEKYDAAEVRVVDVPGVSMELCGGTHVANTADIGLFKISSESGPSAGVRRIEAVCGAAVMPYLSVRDAAVKVLCSSLKARPEDLPHRVSSLQEELRAKSKELDSTLAQLAAAKAMNLVENAKQVAESSFIVAKLDGDVSPDSLKVAAETLGKRLGEEGIVVLASQGPGKVSFVAAVGKEAQKKGLKAGKLIGSVAKVCGGGGGGRPDFAQAGGRDPEKLKEALKLAKETIISACLKE